MISSFMEILIDRLSSMQSSIFQEENFSEENESFETLKSMQAHTHL